MEILDSEFQPPKDKLHFFMSVRAYYLLIGVLTTLNIILTYAEARSDESNTRQTDLVFSFFLPLAILPILSFGLAIFIALLPYKGNRYKQKYIVVAGFLLLLLNTLLFLLVGAIYLLSIYNQNR